MSFLDGLSKLAGNLFGGASQEQVGQAASDHIASLDPNALAGHLKDSLGTMDQSSIAALGRQLLSAFNNHTMSPADADAASNAAGTSAEEVASGNPNAVSALIDYTKEHPELLSTASQAFTSGNYAALQQMAPGFISEITSRIQK
jgi:type IV secretory pathway TrbL component